MNINFFLLLLFSMTGYFIKESFGASPTLVFLNGIIEFLIFSATIPCCTR